MAGGIGVRAFAQHLPRERLDPPEEERAIVDDREAHGAGSGARVDHRPERVHPLLEAGLESHAVSPGPRRREDVDLGDRPDDAGQLIFDRLCEHRGRPLVARARDHEVVGRRPQRSADDDLAGANDPPAFP